MRGGRECAMRAGALVRGGRPSRRPPGTGPDHAGYPRAGAGLPAREAPPFPFRTQTGADQKAARWNTLTREDPQRPLARAAIPGRCARGRGADGAGDPGPAAFRQPSPRSAAAQHPHDARLRQGSRSPWRQPRRRADGIGRGDSAGGGPSRLGATRGADMLREGLGCVSGPAPVIGAHAAIPPPALRIPSRTSARRAMNRSACGRSPGLRACGRCARRCCG